MLVLERDVLEFITENIDTLHGLNFCRNSSNIRNRKPSQNSFDLLEKDFHIEVML